MGDQGEQQERGWSWAEKAEDGLKSHWEVKGEPGGQGVKVYY